jgi:hypothetical protein
MGLGASLLLIAGGAILVWGVNAELAGVDVDAIGWILMVVGIIGLLISVLWMTIWADRRRGDVVVRRERGDVY